MYLCWEIQLCAGHKNLKLAPIYMEGVYMNQLTKFGGCQISIHANYRVPKLIQLGLWVGSGSDFFLIFLTFRALSTFILQQCGIAALRQGFARFQFYQIHLLIGCLFCALDLFVSVSFNRAWRYEYQTVILSARFTMEEFEMFDHLTLD